MKKLVALVLCTALMFSLAACAAQPAAPDAAAPAEPAGDKPASEAAAPESPASDDVVTLSMTSWRTDDTEAWNEINAAFHEEYPNIEVVFKGVTATEYDATLQTKLQSGNAEDIMFLRSFGIGKQIYDAGYVLPLSEENVPNLSKISDVSKVPWTDSADGTVYGAPGSMCISGFFYNKGAFKAAGIDNVPQTWAEMLEDCAKLQAAGYIPVASGLKDAWFITIVASTIAPVTVGGTPWHDKLMKKEVDWTDAAFVKSLKWLAELSEFFPNGYEGIGYDDCQMLFLSEKAAIYPSGSFDLAYLQKTNPDIDLGWFFMPVENAGEKTSINFDHVMGYGINANLKDDAAKLEAAYTYVSWLCDDTAAAMFNNRVIGQYACNRSVSDMIENPLSAEILAGTADQDMFEKMPCEAVSDSSPDYTSVLTEAIYNMLINGQSAEDVCATMVEQQAWYFNN